MKKRKFFSKAASCLVAVSMSVVLFAGCQSSSKTTSQSNSTSTSQTSNAQPSHEQMKKKIQDSIQSLVKAGTITQAQANKIITAYVSRPSGNNQNKLNNQNKPTDKTKNDGGSQAKNPQNKNPLSKLVDEGVITQAQANAVMQKIGNPADKGNAQGQGNIPQKNSGQSSN